MPNRLWQALQARLRALGGVGLPEALKMEPRPVLSRLEPVSDWSGPMVRLKIAVRDLELALSAGNCREADRLAGECDECINQIYGWLNQQT